MGISRLFILALFALCHGAMAQGLVEQVNRGTVSIMSGGVNGTYIRIASNLSDILDSADLRVLTVVGKGSKKNVEDLLYLKGIDIAIVQSDVLEFLKRQKAYPNIANRIAYITKLYNEEFHLLATSSVTQLSDLAGKRVNIGGIGSGTAMTATILFDTLGLAVEVTHHSEAEALEMLRDGELDAIAYVAGKPVQLFKDVSASDALRLIPVNLTPALLDTYFPAQFSAADYPNLIAEGEEITTIAVGAVMAVYRWKNPKSPRYIKVTRFIERFFSNFERLLQPPWHPKWREVNLIAIIPGWTRFKTAEQWLQAHQSTLPTQSITTH